MENTESVPVTHATAGLTVRECVKRIRNGELTSEQLVKDCLAVIEASEQTLQAWESLDREKALLDARAADDRRRQGKPLGALHGIPVGLKDNIDTAEFPTRIGSSIFADNHPEQDAAVVERMREAGAIVLGKTVATEFAFMHGAATRNPHNPDYSPGGSSSGSAAAVGAGHVPLAIGTQTNGSVIRPASFCGCIGYKPSMGMLSRRGVFETSPTLDQVGIFARDIADAALFADVIKGYDNTDKASYLAPRPECLAGYHTEAPVQPAFAWIDMPYSEDYSAAMSEGSAELLELLGARVDRIPAPQSFKALIACHKCIYDYEIFRALSELREHHWDSISETVQVVMRNAEKVTEEAYAEALEVRQAAIDWFAVFFHDYDAVLTASALGEAPEFGAGTGNPICSTVWTLCGLPCLTLPLLSGTGEMPMGIQLVGAYEEDDRLMRTTHWLLDYLQEST